MQDIFNGVAGKALDDGEGRRVTSEIAGSWDWVFSGLEPPGCFIQ